MEYVLNNWSKNLHATQIFVINTLKFQENSRKVQNQQITPTITQSFKKVSVLMDKHNLTKLDRQDIDKILKGNNPDSVCKNLKNQMPRNPNRRTVSKQETCCFSFLKDASKWPFSLENFSQTSFLPSIFLI